MNNIGTTTRIPSHPGQYLNWEMTKPGLYLTAPGTTVSGNSFSYIAPTPKYAEAYASLGPYPTWWSYKAYNIGNQPYSSIDSGIYTAYRTPTLPNWYSMSKVSPKTSAPGNLAAQQQMSALLQLRQPYGAINQ